MVFGVMSKTKVLVKPILETTPDPRQLPPLPCSSADIESDVCLKVNDRLSGVNIVLNVASITFLLFI